MYAYLCMYVCMYVCMYRASKANEILFQRFALFATVLEKQPFSPEFSHNFEPKFIVRLT